MIGNSIGKNKFEEEGKGWYNTINSKFRELLGPQSFFGSFGLIPMDTSISLFQIFDTVPKDYDAPLKV